MPYNPKHIAYLQQLHPWAIARLLPNCQRTIVGRFRSRSDADGHLQCLRQLMPHASFVVVFDCQLKGQKKWLFKDEEVRSRLLMGGCDRTSTNAIFLWIPRSLIVFAQGKTL